MKFFRPTMKKIKFEASKNDPNSYIIFRRHILRYQKIAYAKVFPNHSYMFETIDAISHKEAHYIRTILLKKARLNGKTSGFTAE